MSGLLNISASFSLPDSINLQDLLVTERSSHPKDPDFQREQHNSTPKSNINEVYPNCTSKGMFQKAWPLFRVLVHDSIATFMNSLLLIFFPFFNN